MAEPGAVEPRVLVIGGGMAGAIAALSARAAGASVTVLRRAYGATALSSGAIDVAANPTAPPGDPRPHLIAWEEGAAELARVRPFHPYAVLKAALPRLREALQFASEKLADLLPPPGTANVLLPTPAGTVKPTALAQRSQFGADLLSLPDVFAVVELQGDPRFDARLVASGLKEALARLGRTVEALVVPVDFFRGVEDVLSPPYALAERLDHPLSVARFASELKAKLPKSAKAVLLPPILGRKAGRTCEALTSAVGVPCFETVSSAPSVPGLRLQESLNHALSRAGVMVLEAELREVAFAGGPYPLGDGKALEADAVVLATGKFIGGGIAREQAFEEPVFNLPVFTGARQLGGEFVGDLLSDQVIADHLAFRAGVRIDAQLRPIGVDGRAVFPRLFAAGAVIAGYDPAVDKSGLGVAAFTGFLAGEGAASAARRAAAELA